MQSLPPFTGSSPTIPPNTSFPFISPSDVINKILKLRKSSICPLDIPVDLIKAFSDKIAEPLSNIFNHITKFGKFPSCWKQGFITPVPKKCASLTFTNIRPITLTSVFSKLYEGFLCDWLKDKICPRIDTRQFGNLKKTSTTHYLVHLMHTIVSNLDKPNVWLNLVLVDFQKAFDLVDHTTLIRSLLVNFKLDPLLVNIVISFLSNRSQVVKYKNIFSNPLPIYCGIPQGTLLGPLLFLVMINDIGKDFPQRWKYVDDLSILEVCHRNIKSDPLEILSHISDEAKNLNMKVNSTKSNIMTINFLKSIPAFLDPIPPDISVSSFKLLGVTISSNLKWDIHVKDIVRRANASMSLLKLLNKFNIPPSHSLGIYTSFVRPHLEYACPVWHPGISRDESDKIESIQKRALRIIFKETLVPYSLLLKKAKLETLEHRRGTLCLRFAKNAIINPRTENIFPKRHSPSRHRLPRTVSEPVPILSPIRCLTSRYEKTFVPFITDQINH